MYSKIKKEFKNYVSNYDISDKAIKRKYEHSLRVMKKCNNIAKKIKLSKQDIQNVTIIGLLHDYARFEQWCKYHTFNDLESLDHGDFGVKLLFENNEIKKYTNDSNSYEIIKTAIKYHNKYSYPDNLDDNTKLYCDIIKDCDKLDIFYIFSKGYFEIKENNLSLSKKVEDDFFEKKLISRKDVKTDGDEILLKLALVFDLKFNESFRYIKKKKLIWKLYKKIKNKELFLKYFQFTNEYIKERLK